MKPISLFLAVVLTIQYLIDLSLAIRISDTFQLFSKRSNSRTTAAGTADDAITLDDAYMDDKIIGWDAKTNNPIYDENWSQNKRLLEKYNPGSTERKDLPQYKHVSDKEEEREFLYKGSENAELMREFERRKKLEMTPPAPMFAGEQTKAVDEALLSAMSPEERGKMDKSLSAFQRKVMNAMLGGSQVGSEDCNVEKMKQTFLSERELAHLKTDKAQKGKDAFVHSAGKISKGAHYQKRIDADAEAHKCVEAIVVNDMCDRAAAGQYLSTVLRQAEGAWSKMQKTSIRDHARYEPLNQHAVLERDRWGAAKRCVDIIMPGYWRETVASEKFRAREASIQENTRIFAAMGGMEKGKIEINGHKVKTGR